MIGKIPVNGNQNQDKLTNQGVEDNVDGNQQGGDQQVGETFEETFMNEVRSIGETRTRRPPNTFDDECYLAIDTTADINKPIGTDEAFSGEHSKEWKQATDSEFKPLIENDIWELVPMPEGKNIVGNKWVLKVF